jgi:hypothetical protein
MTTVSKGNSIEIDVVKAALFEDYEILDELGRGGMAIVYRAKERALDREVAIKVLPAILAMDDEFVQRFTHEARTAGKLEHPNIVPIYRVGSSGHVTYFVMKLLSGQSLSRVVRERGKLSVGEVRRILIECGGALGYAAKRGIVHRDIKPDNIMLDGEGRCVITDFGIAKAPGGAQTAAGTSLGTPRYMSPEHAQGIPLDGRSDMYSLGVVAYQCLVGKLPYDAEDPFAILYKHINEPLPRPELVSDEEWALFAVVERMLSKKAADRFQSAEDLIVALGGHVSEPTLVSKSLPAMLVAAQPTEIIPTPTFGLKMKRFWTQDWRSWAGASAIVMGAMFVFMLTSMRGGNATPAVDSAAPRGTQAIAPVVGASSGATTAAQRAADSVAAATKSVALNTTARPGARQTGTTTKAAGTGTAPAPTAPPARRALPSKCPARPGEFHVLLDKVADQRPGRRLPVSFDVCGLEPQTRFSAEIRFRKRSRFGGGTTHSRTFPDEAVSSRDRRIHNIDLAPLSPGDYYLDVIVTNASGISQGKTEQFKLLDR